MLLGLACGKSNSPVTPAPEPGSSYLKRGDRPSWTPDQIRGDEGWGNAERQRRCERRHAASWALKGRISCLSNNPHQKQKLTNSVQYKTLKIISCDTL